MKKLNHGFTLMNPTSESKSTGFTLIELLVVISIIGILAVLISANLNAARSRARDAQRKSDMRNIATALRLYFNDYGTYPGSDDSGNIKGCGTSNPPITVCLPGSEWSAGTGPTVYMNKLSADPLPGQVYKYTFVSSDSYTLQACLENKSDTSGVQDPTTSSWCPTTAIFKIQP